MRANWVFLAVAVLEAEPLRWADATPAMRRILAQAGLAEADYPAWQRKHRAATAERLAAGTAEHIAYFLLQSKALAEDPPLEPAQEARRYFTSLPEPERRLFWDGTTPATPLRAAVRGRVAAFWERKPVLERHRILRDMADRLGWPRERIVLTAYRFLLKQSGGESADAIYQTRGLSVDPFPPSMRAVKIGVEWLRAQRPGPRLRVLLAGPGAELGSRFGVDDSQPVRSPQPEALRALLSPPPATFDCADIRPEVVASLENGPCAPALVDLAADKIPGGPYDLAVATNLLVYLDDLELAAALTNIAQSLAPGGCLLHNDSRFAARVFGEAAGIPVEQFQAVPLGTSRGREQMDRIVIHCKSGDGL